MLSQMTGKILYLVPQMKKKRHALTRDVQACFFKSFRQFFLRNSSPSVQKTRETIECFRPSTGDDGGLLSPVGSSDLSYRPDEPRPRENPHLVGSKELESMAGNLK